MKKRLLFVLLACFLLACLPLTAAAEDVKPESIFANAKTIDEEAQVYDGVPYKDTIDYYANEYKLILTQTADITVKYTSSIGQYMGMVLYREDGTMVGYDVQTGTGLDYDTEGTPIHWEKYVLPQGTYSLVFAADGKSPSFSFLVQGLGVKHIHDYQPRLVVPSTCATQGYTEYACYCGLTQNRDITPPLGHHQVGGICSRCGTLPSGVRYQLDGLGCLTFTGEGAIGDYGQGNAPWYPSREKIVSVVFPAGVTELGSNLFYGCDNLKNILFQGDAPKLAADTFTGVSGTVHYRDTANGWDAVVPQGFGGLLGWDPNHAYETVEVPATCTEEGYTQNICACGAEEKTDIIAPKHETVERSCIECAQWGKCGDTTTWKLDRTTGTLTVSGTGMILDDRSNWNQWDKLILTAVIEDGVTNADYFGGCLNLTSVSLADTVTTISGYAFNECSALPSITLPEGVTLIEEAAFQSCKSLTQIEIPQTVTAIGKSAFANCAGLRQVTMPGTLTSADKAFYGCKDLHVTIRPGSTVIGEKALYKCDALTSVSIPDSVTSIGAYAFFGCTGLTDFVIGDNITSVGGSAFQDCTNLKAVRLANSVTNLGAQAFDGCTSLQSVTLSENLPSIFGSTFLDCTSLESIVIPDGVTAIGSSAFSGCSSLRSVKLPDALTEIGRNAFANCKKLKVLILPDSLTTIGYGTFDNCTALPSIVIPESMTAIDGYAFDSCKMSAVYLKSEFETLNSVAFKNVKYTDVYYPAGTWAGRRNDYGGDLYWRPYTPCDAHSYTTWTVTVAATCEAYGMESSTCDVCGLLSRRYLEPLGHTMDTGVVTAPTCTQQGYTTYTCTTCSRAYQDTYTDPTGHIWDEGVITIEPTEDTDGEKTVTCTVCGVTETRVIMNLNHTHEFGDWVQAKAPTCTEAGLERRTCRCGEEETREVAALGHTEVTDPAEETSCTAPGKTEGKHCSVCGEILIPQEEIPVLPHTEVVSPAVEPTCLTPGKAEGIVCSVCNTVIQAPEDIPSDPEKHVMVGNVCRICGLITGGSSVATGKWCENTNWTLLDDGTFVITGSGQMESDDRLTNRGTPWDDYKDQIRTVIVCEGLTNIASDAFSECANLTKTYIADSVKSIDMGAFYSCAALEAIEIPRGVTTIGMDAYYGCNSVTSIVVPETVTTLEDYAFCYCENLESITIPSTLKTVPYGLTIGCPKLTTVTLGEGIETLTGGAFADCPALETVTVPASVKTVGDYSFSGSGLKEITFLGDAPAFGEGNNVFENVTASAYYPADNATWIDSIMQNYGGTVTWKPRCAEHSWNEGEITTEPTEDAAGVKTFTCTICGDTKTEDIPKLEHIHSYTATAINPTCTEKGYTIHTCVCGDSYTDNEVEPLDHSWDEGVVILEPTEDTAGQKLFTCTFCGETKTEDIPTLDHVHSYTVTVINPTCTEKGYTIHTCACGNTYSDNDVEPLGHSWDEGVVILEPTEDTAGQKLFTCTFCGETKTEDIPTLDHVHSYTTTVIDPTCTEKGFTTHTCDCGDTYTDNETDPLDHSWDEGQVTREPTEDAEGEKTFTCTVCGEVKTQAIPKLEEPGAIKPHSARARLTGDEALAYDALVPFLREIAAGTRTSTEVKIGEGDGIDAEVKFTVKKDDFDYSAVIKALQIDFPYELYWNNYYANSVVQTHTSQRLVSITFRWQVDEAYRGSSEFTTDPEKLAPAHTALANAKAIAAKYDGKSDYEKLHGYCEEILKWTDSAENLGIPEEDIRPWQMISVFDGDPATGVICEGYSKAFQYLCNLGGLVCYPVEGTFAHGTSAGDHQWNVVTLDGENYLVDVTWSEGSLHKEDSTLFLAGGSGSVTGGYIFRDPNGGTYTYNNREDNIKLWGEDVLTLSNHYYTCTRKYTSAVTAPTCTEQGYTTYTCDCGYSYQDDFVDPVGHSWKNGSCTVCGAEEPKPEDLFRIAGDNRFDTAFRVADQMKRQLGVEKFDAIIVASGTNFADALSGSYLAAVKNAPILLSFNDKYNEMTKDYIRENLNPGGKVYILGGTAAVPATMEKGLDGFTVQRLDGKDRFETNLTILLEAGVGDKPILVCTGLSFADSLSASASELPILLVWKDLTPMQKAFLNSLKGNDIYVIGGESAVSKGMEKQVSAYGATKRIGGGNRFETSVAIAEEFFDKPESAVLAYAWNYPDGLCGGALAATMDAPLILTMTKYESAATGYIQGNTIAKGIILGGETLIAKTSVEKIFGTELMTQ